jgi:hypothetical protein
LHGYACRGSRFGISAGALPCDAEALGNLDQDRNTMMKAKRHVIFKFDQAEPDSAITEDRVLDADSRRLKK